MRSVVVLPQPDGPSSTKNSPSSTVKFESCTATKSPKALCRFSTRISAMATAGNFETMMNIDRAGEHGDERPGVERQREGLQQHHEAEPMSAVARFSSGPRRSQRGQLERGLVISVPLICAPLRR